MVSAAVVAECCMRLYVMKWYMWSCLPFNLEEKRIQGSTVYTDISRLIYRLKNDGDSEGQMMLWKCPISHHEWELLCGNEMAN